MLKKLKVKKNKYILVIGEDIAKYNTSEEYELIKYYQYNETMELSYIIVESKNQIARVKSIFENQKIILNPESHNYNVDLMTKYYEFGLRNPDFSVVSNWCGGGYIYNWFNMSYNGPYVWGYFVNEMQYFKMLGQQEYFTTEIKDVVTNENGVPEITINNDVLYRYNHYKLKNEDEIKSIHSKRLKRFNPNKIICFSITHNMDSLNYAVDLKIPGHIIYTTLDVKMRNVISIPNFQLDIPSANDFEHWKWINKYMTSSYDLLAYIECIFNNQDVDINDFKF